MKRRYASARRRREPLLSLRERGLKSSLNESRIRPLNDSLFSLPLFRRGVLSSSDSSSMAGAEADAADVEAAVAANPAAAGIPTLNKRRLRQRERSHWTGIDAHSHLAAVAQPLVSNLG